MHGNRSDKPLYNICMVITLTGENSFGLRQALDDLIGRFAQQYGELALERIDGEEAEYAKLQEALSSPPFLSAKKLCVFRSPSKNKQFAESFEQIMEDLPESTELVIVEPKLDKRLSYFKWLKKRTDFREFPELDVGGLARWLSGQADSKGGELGPGDARYLVERVGANQQLLSTELEKLLLYDPNINRRTIDLLTEPLPSSTVFQLLEAAFAGNKSRMLKLYADQRAQKVEPQQIIAMLAWQLHILAILKTAGDRSSDTVAKEAKINPYVAQKSLSVAKGLTLSRLKKLVSDLLQIDKKMKSTSIDADEALQHYLLALS
jgi:DNA polymerase-3 subunit delta